MQKSLLFIFIIISHLSYGQSMELNYYSDGPGRNITANYLMKKKHHELGFGLGYNINSVKQPDDQSNFYYKRLFATEPLQHLNVNFFYNRYILKKSPNIKPFVFYDLQLKYSTTRSSLYVPAKFDSAYITTDPDMKVLYRNFIENFGPFFWIDNSIGVGFKIDINEKWYIKQKAGFGAYFVIGSSDNVVKNKVEMEFQGFLNLCVGINL